MVGLIGLVVNWERRIEGNVHLALGSALVRGLGQQLMAYLALAFLIDQLHRACCRRLACCRHGERVEVRRRRNW